MQRDFKTQKYAVKEKKTTQHPKHLIRYLPKEPLEPAEYNTVYKFSGHKEIQ